MLRSGMCLDRSHANCRSQTLIVERADAALEEHPRPKHDMILSVQRPTLSSVQNREVGGGAIKKLQQMCSSSRVDAFESLELELCTPVPEGPVSVMHHNCGEIHACHTKQGLF